jgi:hypothetical protein
MKHARMFAALAFAALLAAPAAGLVTAAEAAAKKAAPAATPAKSSNYRQFTGTVIALDATSITVEKGGKTPKQMVFTRHAGMRSTGDVSKDVRVTVYWRDDSGQPVAHRVVVKPATATASR